VIDIPYRATPSGIWPQREPARRSAARASCPTCISTFGFARMLDLHGSPPDAEGFADLLVLFPIRLFGKPESSTGRTGTNCSRRAGCQRRYGAAGEAAKRHSVSFNRSTVGSGQVQWQIVSHRRTLDPGPLTSLRVWRFRLALLRSKFDFVRLFSRCLLCKLHSR
jgi:hypothetical protein